MDIDVIEQTEQIEQTEPELQVQDTKTAIVRSLADLRNTLQKARIGYSNRISAVERGSDVVDEFTMRMLKRWLAWFENTEKEIDQDIVEAVKDEPIVQELVKVKGIGFILAAKLVAMIDINKANTVSSLWKYSGLATIENKDGVRVADRPVKGEKLHYNAHLKSTMYLIGVSFLKTRSPYRSIYDKAKLEYQITKPTWTKMHVHMAAMRRMNKIFLSGLWIVWRTLEGLPVNVPYVFEKMPEHTHYYAPEDFGWEIAKESK